MYIDFVKYLQGELDKALQGAFRVYAERNLDSDTMTGDVVVSQLSGSVYEDSATIPYQLDVFSNDPASTINFFTSFAKQYNNKPFISSVDNGDGTFSSYTIIPVYNTPVVMDKDIEVTADHISRIVVFCSLVILEEVSNVKSLKIDDEEIDFLTATTVFVTEVTSVRISGKQLNYSVEKASGVALNFKIIDKSTIFGSKLRAIRQGVPNINRFHVVIENTDGSIEDYYMLITNQARSFGRGVLPLIEIAMSNTK